MNITSLGYRTDLMLLRLSGSELTDKGEYVVVRTPANPTYWWGNFLLFRTPFAPGDAKARLATFQQEFPLAEHVAFGIDSTDGVVGAGAELGAVGLELERNTVMTATQVKEPARPNDVSEYRFIRGDDGWEQLGLVTDGAGVARFQHVQTHPDDRGRGIAGTLVHRASEYGLKELEAHTLVMVADPEYPAIRLYRALGFADTEIQLQLTKPSPDSRPAD